MNALEICVSPRVYTIHKFSLLKKSAYMAIYHRRDQDILSRKSSHKDTPISVLFLDILVGNKSLQGFVQRKLDKYEIKLTLFVVIYNCATYNCHFPFDLCFNRHKYK